MTSNSRDIDALAMVDDPTPEIKTLNAMTKRKKHAWANTSKPLSHFRRKINGSLRRCSAELTL